MNTLLQFFGLAPIGDLVRAERLNNELQADINQKDAYIKELKANSTDLFEQNQKLQAEVKDLTAKLDKKNYFANIRKMGNMKQQITRLTAELNKYKNHKA